jgi:hypothetical protein
MIALMVLTGDEEEFDTYESRLLDMMEPFEVDELRRRDDRKLEKESEWKRVVRMLAVELRS